MAAPPRLRPAPHRIVDPVTARSGRLTEHFARLGVEEHPGDRQVGCQIARTDVTEVDHRSDRSSADQQVRRVHVGVQPDRLVAERFDVDEASPPGTDSVGVAQTTMLHVTC